MERRLVPYQKTVFVCTNAREGGRLACGNPGRGGLELCAALKDAVKRLGLKGKVRVARSGCLDLCEKGPNIFVFPEAAWHSGVQDRDVPELLRTIAGGTGGAPAAS